jgi:hypothetical protein
LNNNKGNREIVVRIQFLTRHFNGGQLPLQILWKKSSNKCVPPPASLCSTILCSHDSDCFIAHCEQLRSRNELLALASGLLGVLCLGVFLSLAIFRWPTFSLHGNY